MSDVFDTLSADAVREALGSIALTIVVAMDRQGVIGRNNALPWHLPVDLAHFRRLTLGHPVIMGRKTFESIGRPLPQRYNLVVSRNPDAAFAGVVRVDSLLAALRAAATEARAAGLTQVMLIGGAQLYAQALPFADRLQVTEVMVEVADGDARFPEIDGRRWRVLDREVHAADERNPHDCHFVTYGRQAPWR